jgi:hypothetical protein
MATVAQNQSASLDTNYTQEFVDWAANKYGDKAQSMLTSAPSAREAAMEFVNERLKPEIMGDYQQGRSDLTSGQEHAAFSGEHIVQPARGSQQVSGSSGHDAGVSYSSQDGGAHSSGGVGNAQTYGTTQGAEYGGQQGEIILPEQTILFRRVLSSQLFIKGKQPDREAARVISPRRQGWLMPVDAPLQMKGPATLQNRIRSSNIQEPSGSKEPRMDRRVKLLIAVQALMLAAKKYVVMLCRSHTKKIRLSCMNILAGFWSPE